MKAMDTLKKSITADTSIVFTTEGDLFRYLKSANPPPTARPAPLPP
jgi:hypothetical protein